MYKCKENKSRIGAISQGRSGYSKQPLFLQALSKPKTRKFYNIFVVVFLIRAESMALVCSRVTGPAVGVTTSVSFDLGGSDLGPYGQLACGSPPYGP